MAKNMDVRLTCNWCSDEELVERFKRCYIHPLNLSEVNFVTADQPHEWTCIINEPKSTISTDVSNTIGVIMEPSWINWAYKPKLESLCRHILSHERVNNNKYIYHPGLLPMHVGYNSPAITLEWLVSNTMPKKKKLSACVSFNKRGGGMTLYDRRVEFITRALERDIDIDVYGKGWDQSSFWGDPRVKGEVVDKVDAIADYEYTIAIENCIEDSYFTEKLTDCILCDTVPIYFGCPSVERFGFSETMLLDNLDDVDVLSNLGTPQSSFAKTLCITKFNLYSALTKYLNHVTSL